MMTSPWRTARSIPDLGRFMALWLEGRLPQWPGYGAEFGYEESGTGHLVAPLAAANRSGFLTTLSQPAADGRGADGAHWRQRAFVSGTVRARSPLLARLPALEREGLTVIVGRPPEPVALTDRDGEPTLVLGPWRPGRDHLAHEWAGTGRRALRELRRGTTVHVFDPVWGRDDRLWPALALLA
ncbi:DUF6919 domain-containing protein [Streptomyces sp. NPDC058495]|uniref:DUF6919 domain-containing protein n=1 Tax=unclassified Streptomyces TaxID=2593676 RepID=UPI003651FDCC